MDFGEDNWPAWAYGFIQPSHKPKTRMSRLVEKKKKIIVFVEEKFHS